MQAASASSIPEKASAISVPEEIKDSRILVVDDAEVNLSIITATLDACGFTHVETAKNGREALAKIKELLPDLVLLDLMMPDMDGREVCSILFRDWEDHSCLPVIIVQTAITESKLKHELFGMGVRDYINKPMDIIEMAARCIVHLQNRHLNRQLRTYRDQIQSELQEAARLQVNILPSSGNIGRICRSMDISIASHYQPSDQMGGDCWDLHLIADEVAALHMTDFSGHGLLASLNTFRLHTMFQQVDLALANPSLMLHTLSNRLRCILEPGQFATMIYTVLNTRTNKLYLSSAGGPAPVILRTNGTYEKMELTGIPLGIQAETEYDTVVIDFNPGDALILASDGLTETNVPPHDLLDEKVMAKLAIMNSNIPAGLDAADSHDALSEVLRAMLKECILASQRRHIADDESVVILKRNRK